MQNKSTSKVENAVIVGGVRTPFAKQGGKFKDMPAMELGQKCISELIFRYGISPDDINAVYFGQVIPNLDSLNFARDVALGAGLSPTVDAVSFNKACATSYQTIISATQAIEQGKADCIIAGGADSTSIVPLKLPDHLRHVFMNLKQSKSMKQKAKALQEFELSDLAPKGPQVREYSTGLSMGESAEVMAKENGISRKEQDDYAHESHVKAAKAWKEGKFDDEVMTVYVSPKYKEYTSCDEVVRFDSERQKYDDLKLAFDKKYGSITAGNSSPLSDGASAALLMSESKANELGLPILGRIKSHSFAAVNPNDQLLIGPIYAAPEAVKEAKIKWEDLNLIDMHEAFSAQILSVLKVLETEDSEREKFKDASYIGKIDMEKFNVNGGSIALGHPFAATGARQIIQTLNELKRRKEKYALCSACAAGGLSAAVILEAA